MRTAQRKRSPAGEAEEQAQQEVGAEPLQKKRPPLAPFPAGYPEPVFRVGAAPNDHGRAGGWPPL